MTNMTARVVLITGAGSGIGRAAALRFAEAGARVGITGAVVPVEAGHSAW